VNNDGISQGLAMIPSGVFVLAAEADGRRGAMLASFVQQTGFEPPSVVVAVGRDRDIRKMIESSGRFVLSVMGQESKASLKQFWKGVPEGRDPFEGLSTRPAGSGSPIPEDAVGYLECRLSQVIDLGDHCLCVGEVIEGGRVMAQGDPMVRLRKNGFEY
jgi:3-hydroxy-9,10-secoandrosta-1,3,5(10)-triene-9,17-dione monooxygenase reductase component